MARFDRAYGARKSALLVGKGQFTDDDAEGLYAVFVRAPLASARIQAIDSEEAGRMDGVVAILTGADLEHLQPGNISQPMPINSYDGTPQTVPFRKCLATERVVHIGECVAMVVAHSLNAALDAADMVSVDYDELPAVLTIDDALNPGAPQIWDEATDNVVLDWRHVPQEAGEAEIRAGGHTVSVSLVNQRIAVASMEPRAANASFDEDTDTYHITTGTQGVAHLSRQLAKCLGTSPDKIITTSNDVGGAFGMKTPAYPEYVAILLASKLLGAPVRWASTRQEAFVSDLQARDTIIDAELKLDETGRFTELRIVSFANMGAYLGSTGGAMPTTNLARCLPGVYDIPRISFEMKCVVTNTLPVGPYRGAGRPEANFLLERLIDKAADVCGFDRIELRRRNFIRPEQMPYPTPFGMEFDSGDFDAVLKKALAAADYENFEQRRTSAASRGKRRGMGIASFLEHAGGAGRETVRFDFSTPGAVCVYIDAQTGGQSHDDVFSTLTAKLLGIPLGSIVVRSGYSAYAADGTPTIGSRSAMNVGAALSGLADQTISAAIDYLAVSFQLSASEIAFEDGLFVLPDGRAALSMFDVAALMQRADGSVDALNSAFSSKISYAFPNGCHIAEVEIDDETGAAEVVCYVAVDDCGNVLDHHVVEAQVQGGVAQGLGQVMMEQLVYDDAGQLMTGSFMDYPMPRASDMPYVDTVHHVVPCLTNSLGLKGVGEAGTTGAICAVNSAITNALPVDVRHAFQMPATPERLWNALQASCA